MDNPDFIYLLPGSDFSAKYYLAVDFNTTGPNIPDFISPLYIVGTDV